MAQKKRVYLDHAAATPVCTEAQRAYRRASALYGNPSALHTEGVYASEALETARAHVAEMLQVKAHDIYFVSGGTEANNLALIGTVSALKRTYKKIHVVTTTIEHPSVLEPLRALERAQDITLSYVAPGIDGAIRPEALVRACTPDTRLVSIGFANSEIGVIQPLRTLIQALKKTYPDIMVHSDAGQAPLYEATYVHTLGIDMLSLDSGKLYGPRGVGALYIKRETPCASIMYGGSQEGGFRPGTENVALASGFGVACVEVQKRRARERARAEVLKKHLVGAVLKHNGVINGGGKILPHILNVSFKDIDPEYFVAYCDARSIALSTKSACLEKKGEKASHVVQALCSPDDLWRAFSAVRFSWGRGTTKKDIDALIKILPHAVAASVRT